jgi:dihydrofolate reductase
MRKLIASINMTLDGFCDHTAGIADEELHQNANDLLKSVDALLFGRITYQLMENSWPAIVKEPTGVKSVDEFAVLIDTMPKIVFSNTLTKLDWKNSQLANGSLEEVVLQLKQQSGKGLLVGSPSLIVSLMQLGLIDEYRFCVHPVVLGKGLVLFKNITEKITLKLLKTECNRSGAVTLFYEPVK